MASSSVSQEDVEVDFETSSRRSRIRTARARNINPPSRPGEADEECEGSDRDVGGGGGGGGLFPGAQDHDASPKPATRLKEKRMNSRPNHTNKGKQQRDRRKLREKRRSTGVVHLPSTESTGGSTGEDEELLSMTAETRRNTHYNEHIEKEKQAAAAAGELNSVVSGVTPSACDHKHKKSFTSHRNKSPSDLEADDEDNQDYDSLTGMSDSTLSLVHPAKNALHSSNNLQTTRAPANGRPATPTSESVDELLESAREENRRLLGLLEERDRRISLLESRLSILTGELTQACNDRSNLRQENNALIHAMASLTAK